MSTTQASAMPRPSRKAAAGDDQPVSERDERFLQELLVALAAAKAGDQVVRLSTRRSGLAGEVARAFNELVDQNTRLSDEVTRVAREVGTEGKLGGQARIRGVSGIWKDLTDSVNSMAANLTEQVRNISQVTTAVAQGDLSRKITVDARGEVAELK